METIFGRVDGGVGRKVRKAGATVALVIALLAVVFGPQMASAASARVISAGSYKAGQKCWVQDGENICEKRFDGSYNLLQVNGKHFTKLGPVYVQTVVLGLNLSDSGSVLADANGNFVYRSASLEVCSAGLPLTVQAYDFAAGSWSNIATVFACVS